MHSFGWPYLSQCLIYLTDFARLRIFFTLFHKMKSKFRNSTNRFLMTSRLSTVLKNTVMNKFPSYSRMPNCRLFLPPAIRHLRVSPLRELLRTARKLKVYEIEMSCCCCCYFILSRLLFLAFSVNLGLLCIPHPGMGPLL